MIFRLRGKSTLAVIKLRDRSVFRPEMQEVIIFIVLKLRDKSTLAEIKLRAKSKRC